MKLPTLKIFSLYILVSITFLPYIASFMTLDPSLLYRVEIIALIFWYITSLTIPLVIKELSTGLLFWIYLLVLVGIPICSDMVYRITDITPSMWWYAMKHLMPVAWYMQGVLTQHYYSFIFIFGLLVIPGCVFFVAICWIKQFAFKQLS